MYVSCYIISNQPTSQKRWNLRDTTCHRQGKFPSVQADPTLDWEIDTHKKSGYGSEFKIFSKRTCIDDQ